MRMLLGLTGLAALSALATAIVAPPAVSDASTSTAGTTTTQTQVVPAPSVIHRTKFVQLKPGQTAPPSAVVKAAPVPTPRIVVVTTTRQSGKP